MRFHSSLAVANLVYVQLAENEVISYAKCKDDDGGGKSMIEIDTYKLSKIIATMLTNLSKIAELTVLHEHQRLQQQ